MTNIICFLAGVLMMFLIDVLIFYRIIRKTVAECLNYEEIAKIAREEISKRDLVIEVYGDENSE